MKIRIQLVLIFATAVALSGCNPGVSGGSQEASAGNADFSYFVALGDSLSTGYADGALYRDAQMNSFPKILAEQFTQVGGGAFTQPLMPAGATGSLTFMGVPIPGRIDRQVLVATGNPDRPFSPTTITPTQSTAVDVPIPGPYNNMGIPGANMYHLGVAGYGNPAGLAVMPAQANPYFVRSASAVTASMLGDAVAQAPTFFSLWIGANDVLGYATAGGTGVDQTGNADITTYGASDITDPGFFNTGGTGAATGLPGYAAVVAALKANGAKGVLINVPDVAAIPYFTTVPFNAVPLDATQAADLAALSGGYSTALDIAVGGATITAEEAERRRLTFAEGQNAILIEDDSLTDLSGILIGPFAALAPLAQARQATPEDFILLPSSTKLGTENPMPPSPVTAIWGVSLPLEDGDALTENEYGLIEAARASYNATIQSVADADPDLVLWDAASRLTVLNESGIDYGSGRVTSEFATGGFFSLDGIHPTGRGSAIIANEIAGVINAGFDAFIPPVDPNAFPTAPLQ